MLNYDKYVRAESLEQAYELAQSRRNAILGGSIWMRMMNGRYGTVIDLCDLGLDIITEVDDYYKIGAYVTLRDLECSKELNAYFHDAFFHAVEHIEGVQFRNLATVGGSVVQKMGFSDLCTLLLAMGAEVELYSVGRMPIAEYFVRDRRIKDLLVSVWIPKAAANTAYSVMQNTKTDIAVLNCAITRTDDGLCIAVGARPGIAKAVAVTGKELERTDGQIRETVDLIMERVMASMKFEGNNRAGKEYRETICSVLVERALEQLQ